jgi:hypothetical protein
MYKPDGTNEIQSAEARGKALHQVPSTMQRLQQNDLISIACIVVEVQIKKEKKKLLRTGL